VKVPIIVRYGRPRLGHELSDRPARRVRISLIIAPGLALGFVVLALIAAIFILPSRAPGGVGSDASPGLGHIESAGISFDYPAQSRVISDGFNFHYGAVSAVVGTGDWKLPCWTIAPTNGVSGVQCGSETWDVPAGSIVVYISASYGGHGPEQLRETPPADAIPIGDGIVATDGEAAASSTWVLYLPNGLYVAVDARFASPGIDAMRAQVRSIVLTIRPARPAG